MARGRLLWLARPLNSREEWPLWVEMIDREEVEPFEVFIGDGNLSPEFLALLT